MAKKKPEHEEAKRRPKKPAAELRELVSPSPKRTNAELAFDFLTWVKDNGHELWLEDHRHDNCMRREFVFLLKAGEEGTPKNAIEEHTLYEFLGQWLVKNATPKSRKETRNILDELLWLIPKKQFTNSPLCLPEAYQ